MLEPHTNTPADSTTDASLSKRAVKSNIKAMIGRGLWPLLGTLIAYKLLSVFIFLPAIDAFWALILRLSPVHYITSDTLFSVLKVPYVPAAILIIGVLAAFWAMFEFSLIIIGLDHAFKAERISLKSLCISAFREIEHALTLRNIPILICAAVLIPFTNVFMSSNYISQLVVPEYIMDVIRKNGIYNAIYILIFAACIIFCIMAVFVFHAFILDKETFGGALRRSLSYIKKNPFATLWTLLKKNILLVLRFLFIILAAAAVAIGVLIYLGFNHADMARSLGNAISLVEVPILTYLIECAANINQFAIISALFYAKRGQAPAQTPDDIRHFRIGSAAFVAFTVIGSAALTALIGWGIYLLPDDIELFGSGTTTISYHRGYCAVAPENTIPAFEAAINDGCDIIELDVQQTKDGVVVVAHDPTLKRTAGISERIADLTYEELEQVDVGSFFSAEYAQTRVPTLEEVLKLCQGRTDLNIEIKQNGSQPQLEAETVRLIREYDFTNHCTVTSLSYESLDRVKSLEPAIRTGYILAIGVGSYYDLPAADFFSVEASFITSGMVSEIHMRGKTVSAWTINRQDDAERLYYLGVDDMITEDPAMVRDVIANAGGLGDFIMEFVNELVDAADDSEPEPGSAVESESATAFPINLRCAS